MEKLIINYAYIAEKRQIQQMKKIQNMEVMKINLKNI